MSFAKAQHPINPFLSSSLGSDVFKRALTPPTPLPLWSYTSTMSTQICRVLQLVMHSACCQSIRSRSCVRRAALAPVGLSGLSAPGAPVLHRRAYSLDSLSSGPGRPTPGPSSQQPRTERTSPSSALTHRHLSAVAVQVWLYVLCVVFSPILVKKLL